MSKQVPFSRLAGWRVSRIEGEGTALTIWIEDGRVFVLQPCGRPPPDLRLVEDGPPLDDLAGSFLRIAAEVPRFTPTSYDVSQGVCYVLGTLARGLTCLTWERKANGCSAPITVTEYQKGEFSGL